MRRSGHRPISVFLCCLTAFAAAGRVADSGARAGEDNAVLVKTAAPRRMRFAETIGADGAIAVKNHAMVSPKIAGTLDAVFVREGDLAARDATRLFQVDNVKLRQALDLERQNLILARSTLDERRAAMESARSDMEQAERDLARTRSLYEERVTTLSDLERIETNLHILRAALKVTSAQATLAEQSVDKAVIAVAMAERDLADSVALSPVDGVVSRRYKEPGESAELGVPVVRVEDTADLKAVAHLPGQFYSRVRPGATRLALSVYGRPAGEFPVTYRAPSIDSAYRTFEIWADVPGDGEHVVPGALCAVDLFLAERDGVGVPGDAVQFRNGRQWLFLAVDGRAVMVEATTGLANDGYVELVDSALAPDARIVVQGQFLLDDGTPIRE